jgi:hypothetical protein
MAMGKNREGKVYHCNGWTGEPFISDSRSALVLPVAPDQESAVQQDRHEAGFYFRHEAQFADVWRGRSNSQRRHGEDVLQKTHTLASAPPINASIA